ncbi:hypothetical protein A3C23_02255 [Candidatus Roizmanbacteria bacterium RIFCSPHIGHO2_02_FULL_37_13b]|uniref:Zinc/iron permease n=1 Tax=Candidatus Roizmanbacteria bacterium RIFCSPLOWO2_02_FULL_36_11 TaxID=1802071 RepID=A0A1F7JGK7_9BACT|nr:MAG: hypothetical protein A3C23_02255 [Candidatus Roizmanbacteria bacterium RIFCSPHIGHO2_02_FULL_37_13b]OGK54750.1 MAG: hypothetical protein A3H78_05675 [Candidatus Roizmanbacteria bacterium RIFCSPLOWO2_02_FULL_36_11]
MSTFFLIILASVVTSLISFVGIVIINEKIKDKLEYFLISFAAGVLLSTAFLDLLPEAQESAGESSIFLYALLGIVIFFFLERIIVLLHHHDDDKPVIDPSVTLVLIGDSIHNFFDGLAIAAAFLINPSLGLTTTLAIIAHEIPHEIADYSIFIHGGLKNTKALFYNFLSALTAVIGGILGFYFLSIFEKFSFITISMTAGIFIYIACTDLIPEVHRDYKEHKKWTQTISFLSGIIIIYLLQTLIKH